MGETRWAPIAVALLVVAVLLGIVSQRAPEVPSEDGSGRVPLSSEQRSGTFTFAPDVHEADRRVVLAALAASRPEARAMVEQVDGGVLIEVGPTEAGTVGVTSYDGDGFTVRLDLAAVTRDLGAPGIPRLVLHELAHVVDPVLVPIALDAALGERIPAGYACAPDYNTSACAPQEERFAETFAKWATGDIGVQLPVGYAVAPPDDMENWGRQLVDGVSTP